MKFFVSKWARYGWKKAEDEPLTKLVSLSDYPVSSRPLLPSEDSSLFEDNDGVLVEKLIPLAI